MATRLGVYQLLFVLAVSILSDAARGEGPWPQWRGPNRDDVTTEAGLVQEFGTDGPQRVWLFENCGSGYSGPAIVGNQLYILGAREGVDLLLCLDATNGKELWATPLGQTLENDWGDGPRSTPTVDGDFIYVLTGTGNLACVKTDGTVVWKKSMEELGGKIPVWGYCESPLVLGDKVFCTPGEAEGAIAALDKKSGDLAWQTEDLADVAHYSSIVPMEYDGKTILVQLLFKEVVGVDPVDGTVLWTVPFPGNVAVIPTPVVSGNMVYVTAGYGAGCMMVKLSGSQDKIEAEVIYENKNMTNHHGGVILIDGYVYGHSDGKGWVCQNLESGELAWREREALGKGAIAYADGRFYCLSEDSGELVLIAASSEGWEEHGRFTLDPQTKIRSDKGKIWTHPVIADGKLYLRDQDLLFSFDVKAE
jgi:outer membrane protein assembly factor BamB